MIADQQPIKPIKILKNVMLNTGCNQNTWESTLPSDLASAEASANTYTAHDANKKTKSLSISSADEYILKENKL